MKITVCTGPWLPVPPIKGGSTGRIWQGIGEAMVRAGHSVTIVCRDDPKQPPRESINGVDYRRIKGAAQTGNIAIDLVKDLLFGFRCLNQIPRSDIYVIHDFWLPALLSITRRDGRIVNVIGRYPKHQFFLYRKVQRTVALSKAIRDAAVSQSPYLEDRIVVIHNPVDCDRFAPRPDKRRKSILFVGRIHPEKGLELLLDAFRQIHEELPDLPLIIVGPQERELGGGGADYLKSLQKKAEGLPVEWKGSIFDEDALAATFQSSSVFCYPSVAEKGESFPLAPLEAMSTGAVTVVSSLECFQDAITPDIDGIIFDHRTENPAHALANALKKAVDAQQSSAISKRAISRAQEFSYDSIAEIYLNDFASLT